MDSGLQSDYDYADALVGSLVEQATGGGVEKAHYMFLRDYFVLDNRFIGVLPKWFSSKRSPDQFWQFIKRKFPTYAERREFLWEEFEDLLAFCERTQGVCAEPDITAGLELLNSDDVNRAWAKALERLEIDPEGAITAGRTLLESICKHILDQRNVSYDVNKIKINQLYKLVAKELNLAPEQHDEELFKQILGGCSSVVSGLGTLRNKLGDAHGKGVRYIRPHPRHARLVVNLAGAMSLFLVETANK